ncbi:MAG: hypothetical protein ACRDID_12865 [Ktedonobacterales bacterium]
MRRRRAHRLLARLSLSLIALLALFIAFEVVIRHMPPDGLTYTEVKISQPISPSGKEAPATRALDYSIAYDSRRQATIDTWYNALNRGQDIGSFPHCNGGPPNGPFYERTFTFTWRGIAVESATAGSPCGEWLLSSGGIPDFWQYRSLWTDPRQAPDAPPLPSPPPTR